MSKLWLPSIVIVLSFTLFSTNSRVGRQRELCVKTLHSAFTAKISRYYMLSGETNLIWFKFQSVRLLVKFTIIATWEPFLLQVKYVGPTQINYSTNNLFSRKESQFLEKSAFIVLFYCYNHCCSSFTSLAESIYC